jgi:UDP-GlcNAc:undecaprenyl-phosphate GlcNAc-1-phosphate transferase
LIAGLLNLVLIPVFIYISRKSGILFDEPGGRKNHSGNIPLVGGIAFFISYAFFNKILLPSLAILIVGIIDDEKDLNYKIKLIVEVAVALYLSFSIKNLYIFNNAVGPLLSKVFYTIWIVGIINAVNLIDGMNGLFAGAMILSSLMTRDIPMSTALLAYLPFNLAGKVFMGDAGTLSVGLILSYNLFNSNMDLGWSTLFIGYPFFEVTFSFFRRIIKGKNPFLADNKHLHHVLPSHIGKIPTLSLLLSFSFICNILPHKFYSIVIYAAMCCILVILYCSLDGSNGNFKHVIRRFCSGKKLQQHSGKV